MKFGEEKQVRRKERNQYKEDLDYLASLRKAHGDMSQDEYEQYRRKIDYMNDVTEIKIYLNYFLKFFFF